MMLTSSSSLKKRVTWSNTAEYISYHIKSNQSLWPVFGRLRHSPSLNMGFTLPSPTSPSQCALSLMTKKESIECEISRHISILRSNNIDMSTPLVDADGFPRSDIDLWAVRKARVRIIELRNDMKDIMNELGKTLEDVYAQPATSPTATNQEQHIGSTEEDMIPFARVDGVAPGSPAAEAGLQREDLILKFGSLIKSSFNPPSALTPLAEFVSHNENVSGVSFLQA